MTVTRTAPAGRRRMAVPMAIGVTGLAVFLALPVFVGGLVEDRGFTEQEAGLISSFEMGGLAIGNIGFLLLSQRLSARVLCIGALLLFALSNVATPAAHGFHALVVTRALCGIGGGAAFAIASALLCGAANPARAFSIFLVAQLSFQALALWVGPTSLQIVSVDVLYAAPALAAMALLPFVGALPTLRHSVSRKHAVRTSPKSLPTLVATLLAMMLLFAGTGGVWTYLERIGAAAGLTPLAVGLALGASGIAGILGPALTLWLSGRRRLVLPICGLMALLIASQLLLGTVTSPFVYLTLACAFNFAWNALIPYYYAVLAHMDPQGRAAVAGNVLATIGLSVGAAVAALLANETGYRQVLVSASMACIGSLILLLWPARKLASGTDRNGDAAFR